MAQKNLQRTFQVFTKPCSASCNLACDYCYYLDKKELLFQDSTSRMSDKVLETYIKQHIYASSDPVITFSWHGGEPTLMGIDFFRKVRALQKKYQPSDQKIANGIQTNGILINDEWCDFFVQEQFFVGLSLDGPPQLHDQFRKTKGRKPTGEQVLDTYHLLRKKNINCDVLCVVNSVNVQDPLALYLFFKDLQVPYITFLPLVEPIPRETGFVSERSVNPIAFGNFLCQIFDEWQKKDVETIKINLFEEISRVAFGNEPAICIFRKTCGDIPVVESDGRVYSCDHFVNEAHYLGNINHQNLGMLLNSQTQKSFGCLKQNQLPEDCITCDVLDMCNGGCPKDRIIKTSNPYKNLNYLCKGYQIFFQHIRPFVNSLSQIWELQKSSSTKTKTYLGSKIKRNTPCPCGSGKKYKKCCLNS